MNVKKIYTEMQRNATNCIEIIFATICTESQRCCSELRHYKFTRSYDDLLRTTMNLNGIATNSIEFATWAKKLARVFICLKCVCCYFAVLIFQSVCLRARVQRLGWTPSLLIVKPFSGRKVCLRCVSVLAACVQFIRKACRSLTALLAPWLFSFWNVGQDVSWQCELLYMKYLNHT